MSSRNQAGKGDDPRPVDPQKFRKNHAAIKWTGVEMTPAGSGRLRKVYGPRDPGKHEYVVQDFTMPSGDLTTLPGDLTELLKASRLSCTGFGLPFVKI